MISILKRALIIVSESSLYSAENEATIFHATSPDLKSTVFYYPSDFNKGTAPW